MEEAAKPKFPSLNHATNYLVPKNSKDQFRTKDFIDDWKSKIDQCIKSGEILNPTFIDFKDSLNRIVDRITNQWNSNYMHNGKYANEEEALQDIGYLQSGIQGIRSLPGKMKKCKNQSRQAYKDLIEINDELQPFVKLIDHLKTICVKTTTKRAAEKEVKTQYIQKQLSSTGMKFILDKLKEMAEQSRPLIMKDYLLFFRNLKAATEAKGKIYYHDINKEAKEACDNLIDGFVHKSTRKLAGIVNKKGNLKDAKLKNTNHSRGKIECDIICTFGDGSSFTMNNQVVGSYSKYGNHFYRYPSTFRSVKFSNGTSMTKPSIEKMEKEFV
jgi:hypothetical protein